MAALWRLVCGFCSWLGRHLACPFGRRALGWISRWDISPRPETRSSSNCHLFVHWPLALGRLAGRQPRAVQLMNCTPIEIDALAGRWMWPLDGREDEGSGGGMLAAKRQTCLIDLLPCKVAT